MLSRIQLRTRTLILSITAAVVTAFSLLAASPAEAYPYSNVYVSLPTWLGNCPGGGSVTGIWAANGDLWVTPASGDWGDDLVYPKVNLYANNQISAQPFCNRPWYKGGPYYGPAVTATIYPTRKGQTFWIGPAGQVRN